MHKCAHKHHIVVSTSVRSILHSPTYHLVNSGQTFKCNVVGLCVRLQSLRGLELILGVRLLQTAFFLRQLLSCQQILCPLIIMKGSILSIIYESKLWHSMRIVSMSRPNELLLLFFKPLLSVVHMASTCLAVGLLASSCWPFSRIHLQVEKFKCGLLSLICCLSLYLAKLIFINRSRFASGGKIANPPNGAAYLHLFHSL